MPSRFVRLPLLRPQGYRWTPEPLPSLLNAFSEFNRGAPWMDAIPRSALDSPAPSVDVQMRRFYNHEFHPHRLTRIRLEHGASSTHAWAGGVPYQLATERSDKVFIRSRSTLFKSTHARLPLRATENRRTGDPNAEGHDCQCFIVNRPARKYYEISSLGLPTDPRAFLTGSRFQAYAVTEFDLSKPWTHQMRGSTTASNIPLLPMIPTVEEFDSHDIGHALQLCVPNYSSSRAIGYASGTDGKDPKNPLRAGQQLALTTQSFRRLLDATPGVTHHAAALLRALHVYGCVVADHTDPLVGPSLRLPQTSALDFGDLTLDLLDFRAINTL